MGREKGLHMERLETSDFIIQEFVCLIKRNRVIKLEFPMLYNCGMIFFILSFFVGYILSFSLVKLKTIRLSARAGAHIEFRCSRSCKEDVTTTDVMIKNPDGKWIWDANDVMPGSDEQGFLLILKKKQLVVDKML